MELILAGASDDDMDVSVLKVWKAGHTAVLDSVVVVDVIAVGRWKRAIGFFTQ